MTYKVLQIQVNILNCNSNYFQNNASFKSWHAFNTFFSISVHRQGIQISMWKEGMKIEVKHVKR